MSTDVQNFDITKVGDHWEKRVLDGGFVQHREIYSAGRRGPWQFTIVGFCMDDVNCTVQMETDRPKQVPIDGKGRITVNGRKYGRKHWNH